MIYFSFGRLIRFVLSVCISQSGIFIIQFGFHILFKRYIQTLNETSSVSFDRSIRDPCWKRAKINNTVTTLDTAAHPASHSDFKKRIITSRRLTHRASVRKRRVAFFRSAEAYVPLNNAASNERDSVHARDAPTAAKRARILFFYVASHTGRGVHSPGGRNIWRAAFCRPSLHSPLFHSSSLRLRSLPAGRTGRWPDLVKHIRGSLRGLWTVRSDERILQRLLCDGKG